MDYKEQTISTYRAEAQFHADKFTDAFLGRTVTFVDEFLSYVPVDSEVLDLGCGPGAHAAYMQSQQRSVKALDLTPEFVEMARKQGVSAEVGDMETVQYQPASFKGIWCYTSLLHLPKTVWPTILQKTNHWLKQDGVLYLAVKEGEGEAWETSKLDSSRQRFFSFANQREMQQLLVDAGYKLLKPIERDVHPNGRVVFLMCLCQKV